MADDVDYMAVASITDGMVGAELANIIEVAAILDPDNVPKPALANTVETPTPPGTCPIHFKIQSYKSLAILLLDIKFAININNGIVVKVKLLTLLYAVDERIPLNTSIPPTK